MCNFWDFFSIAKFRCQGKYVVTLSYGHISQIKAGSEYATCQNGWICFIKMRLLDTADHRGELGGGGESGL